VRFNSGGAVMTADQVDHRSCRALDLLRPEQLTSTDCPEARMAGGNHHHHNNNQVR
jgi:hypothetical protein